MLPGIMQTITHGNDCMMMMMKIRYWNAYPWKMVAG